MVRVSSGSGAVCVCTRVRAAAAAAVLLSTSTTYLASEGEGLQRALAEMADEDSVRSTDVAVAHEVLALRTANALLVPLKPPQLVERRHLFIWHFAAPNLGKWLDDDETFDY